MKIFVAGASGAVGRYLVPLLLEAGHTVTAITRSEDHAGQIQAAGAQPILADALNRDAVFAAMNVARPEIVIHQLTDLRSHDFGANSRIRVEGTRNLVDAALALGVERMIAQSYYQVYVAGNGPAREDEPLDIHAPGWRGETVAGVQALEQAVAEMPAGVVLRYGSFYGPGTWYSRDEWVTEQFRKGEFTATDAVSSFIHVADAANAALQALGWPAGVVNIADDEPAAAVIWAPVYAKLVGAPPPPVKPGREGWERGISNAKAYQLGWRPMFPTWREGFVNVLT